MKRSIQWFVVAVLAAALMAGCASDLIPPGLAHVSGKGIAYSVEGSPTYTMDGRSGPLKANQTLPAGTTVETGADSDACLSVNGLTSAVRVTANSILELTEMDYQGAGRSADTETVLDLKRGTIVCLVKKLTANSRYEVHTPNGRASVHGTDFQMTVTTLPSGKARVDYVCVTGQPLVDANVDGQNVTKLVADLQQWIPGEGDVTTAPSPT